MVKIDYVQPTTITSEELEKGHHKGCYSKDSSSEKKNSPSNITNVGKSHGNLESGLLKKD